MRVELRHVHVVTNWSLKLIFRKRFRSQLGANFNLNYFNVTQKKLSCELKFFRELHLLSSFNILSNAWSIPRHKISHVIGYNQHPRNISTFVVYLPLCESWYYFV